MPDFNTSSSSNSKESGKESSDLSQCLKKVELIGKQLEKFNKRITSDELQTLDEADLSVRLDYVESLNTNFENSLSIVENYQGDSLDETIRDNFMKSYFEAKAKLKRKIVASGGTRSLPSSSTFRQFSIEEPRNIRKTRLPELKIPAFSGSYTDWPNFFAMFTTVIANDMDLTNIEKFQHLRSLLTGSALDTISSLEPNDANYDKAIELLKNRFDNKLLLFQMHIKEVFGLKNVEKGSASSLRQLSDKLNAHIRALETICTKEQLADGFLVNLVVSKLDHQTQAKWEEGLQNDRLPTWPFMASFLERRCRMMENLESSMKPTTSNQQSSKKSNSQGRNVLIASGAKQSFCTFCNANDHYISNCSQFSNLSPTLRFREVKRLNLCLNCLRKGHRLQKCKFGPCNICQMKHHSLLHIDNNFESLSTPTQANNNINQGHPPSSSQPPQVQTQSTLVSSNPTQQFETADGTNILLATAIVLVKTNSGVFVPCRAILDSASQLNFITTRFVNQAQLKVRNSNIVISGIGEGNILADKSTEILIKSCHSEYSVSFVAVVIPSITEYQPNRNLKVNDFKIPHNIKLADSNFCERGRIDLLIGAGLFFELMSVGQIRCGNNSTILQKTRLGWVVSGGGASHSNACSLAAASKAITKGEHESLADIVKSFWEVEQNFGNPGQLNSDDEFCEQHFIENTVRLSSGEYSVSLPKKINSNELGDSYGRAHSRFLNLERKLNKLPAVKKKYSEFMSEYIDLKHMSLVTDIPPQTKTYFLPHHCVHKEESTTTKLRVVFDGSAKTNTGLSLNETLHSGPTIQAKLFNTILRFRFFKIALSGDICKMYRCVLINPPDDYLQCILWRNSSSEDIQIYKLNTVTYGTKPAAFLAIRAMHQLAFDERELFPIGANIVTRDFYVDDLISGGDSIEEVIEIREQITSLLKRGNFQIRKWCSNDDSVLENVPAGDRETFLEFHDGTNITKTLESTNISKRTVLSSIARLYDPLGLIGPVITKAKVFMQNLWKIKLDWDESLPQDLLDSDVQIHAFCDASKSAYGACIYVRSEHEGEIRVNLLCSKSRVAPLKVLTIPKLELSAALLLAELLDDVSSTLGKGYECHCWSDSMVVLSWLREESSNYNIFVSNRVSRIQNLTKNMMWHHVPTAKNPADILSRGSTPEELVKCNLWKNGPSFLYKNFEHWPNNMNFIEDLPERRRAVLIASTPKIAEHIMGSLPHERVQPSRAFSITGIDFCGPFYYKSEAIHMELVSDLSTSSFLSSLKRFISIRGKPKTIWSDNATNFVGAKNELGELRQLFFNQTSMQQIQKHCFEDEINWKFIPPRSPHFGGLWEAAVKSAKYHFYRTVGQSVLSFDELRTLVCEICAVLNSRPLCQISEDPNDLEVLTPGHFLVGAPLTTISEPDVTDLNINRLNRWQKVCYMQQIFWKKWSSSYLALLQERSKWKSQRKNVAIGDMVLVKDDNLPPLKWLLGRVVDVVRGNDEIVRVAIIKTINGIIRRSVAKLAVLPINDNVVETHSLPTGGGCSDKPLCEKSQ
ncbi:uncharacterized protein LOC142231336 [Haematobia irritans]|uniref:uncharacterized protein LOC142231336 n=1 Tax=Haematobia irritans TaxID=7368 RepID=UPI003F50B53C